MAQFKYSNFLREANVPAFDRDWQPGQIVANGGIYRCKTCGDETAVAKGGALPANHHRHELLGPVVWQMIVFAQQRP